MLKIYSLLSVTLCFTIGLFATVELCTAKTIINRTSPKPEIKCYIDPELGKLCVKEKPLTTKKG